MRETVLAIVCSDIHLQQTPPRCREIEPNWFEAMKRPLLQLDRVAKKYNAPILCAGDVFTYWRSQPELINWAIDNLPYLYAIPGQHDLPQHNYEEKHRGAYHTLVKANKIFDISPQTPLSINDLTVFAYPWGFPVSRTGKKYKGIKVALIHEYNWIKGHTYPKAHPSRKLSEKRKVLFDYDIVVFGDNHNGFHLKINNTEFFNCGTLMRRRTDEVSYKPQVGLILSNGSVKSLYLDTSLDKIDLSCPDTIDTEEVVLDVEDFLEELNDLSQDPMDFREVVTRYLDDNSIRKEVCSVLLEAIEP